MSKIHFSIKLISYIRAYRYVLGFVFNTQDTENIKKYFLNSHPIFEIYLEMLVLELLD